MSDLKWALVYSAELETVRGLIAALERELAAYAETADPHDLGRVLKAIGFMESRLSALKQTVQER